MAGNLRLYARYIAISARSQMEYRGSFAMLSLGQFLVTLVEFASIGLLFQRFGGISGWSLPEVGFFYGMINTAFAFADAASRGFDIFGPMIRSGDFDRLMLRPRSTVLQVAGTELTLRRIGRLLQGSMVLAWSCARLNLRWTVGKVALLVGAIGGGICLFIGVLVLQATAAFWTTETLEVFNSLSYGGVQTAQYPISIYQRWLQRFFTYAVPLAAISYFPGIAILGHSDPLGSPLLLRYLTPVLGPVFLFVTTRLWRLGVRHYQSTGS
jgi:ABC-2 type transport system permease protein